MTPQALKKSIAADDYRRLTKQIEKLEAQRERLPVVASGWRPEGSGYHYRRAKCPPHPDVRYLAIVERVGSEEKWQAWTYYDGYHPTIFETRKAAKQACDDLLRARGVLL
jgi:hypothetical protein